MRKLRDAALAATMILGLAPSVASAAELLILNHDFEANPYADGGYANSGLGGGAPKQWKGAGVSNATWNPAASGYIDHEAHGTVLSTYNMGLSPTVGVNQTIGGGYTITANTRYTLTLDVGNRADVAGAWGYGFGLVAGDGLSSTPGDFFLKSMTGNIDPATGLEVASGTFKTLTMIFETGATGPEIGQQLTVMLGSFSNASGVYGAEYDNVHLDATALGVSAVPEPATWAMMITGFGLAGGALRRRRHAAALA